MSSLRQHTAVTLGTDTADITLSLPETIGNVTLKDAFSAANLRSICQAGASTCSQPVRWKLDSWGACSGSCGGGVATRAAACVQATTGEAAVLYHTRWKTSWSLMRHAEPTVVHTHPLLVLNGSRQCYA